MAIIVKIKRATIEIENLKQSIFNTKKQITFNMNNNLICDGLQNELDDDIELLKIQKNNLKELMKEQNAVNL